MVATSNDRFLFSTSSPGNIFALPLNEEAYYTQLSIQLELPLPDEYFISQVNFQYFRRITC